MFPTYTVYAHVDGVDYQVCYRPIKIQWSEDYLMVGISIVKEKQHTLEEHIDYMIDWSYKESSAIITLLRKHKNCQLKCQQILCDDFSPSFDIVDKVVVA